MKLSSQRNFVALLLLLSSCLCLYANARDITADYPIKPIRMTVSSGTGGGLDFVSRLVSVPLSEALGQSVVVDNRAGASGSIAAEITALSPPDGYTLMMLSASLVVFGVANKTRYDLYKDFDAIAQVAASPYMLTVHPGLNIHSIKDLVTQAKTNPEKLSYASTGNASLANLATELFSHQTGIRLTHVPYRGVGAAMTDLLSGQVQLSFLSGGSVFSQIRSQKLRALAVASATRSKYSTEIPTLIEAGVEHFIVMQWHGLLAPHGLARSKLDRLNREVVRAVQRPDVAARLALDSTEPVGSSPEQFTEFLRKEKTQWLRAAKIARINND